MGQQYTNSVSWLWAKVTAQRQDTYSTQHLKALKARRLQCQITVTLHGGGGVCTLHVDFGLSWVVVADAFLSIAYSIQHCVFSASVICKPGLDILTLFLQYCHAGHGGCNEVQQATALQFGNI